MLAETSSTSGKDEQCLLALARKTEGKIPFGRRAIDARKKLERGLKKLGLK
jgi:hypothetical protein